MGRVQTGQNRVKGFTLLELLVTMALIGIAVGAATFQLSSGTRPYEIKNAVRLLSNQSNLALEEAILQGKELGLRFDIDHEHIGSMDRYRYNWLIFDNEKRQWQLLQNQEALEEGRLPDGLRLELEVEGLPVIIGSKEEKSSLLTLNQTMNQGKNKKLEKQSPPDIYFLSSGELIAFKLAITDTLQEHEPKFQIIGEMVGKLRLLYPGEDELELD